MANGVSFPTASMPNPTGYTNTSLPNMASPVANSILGAISMGRRDRLAEQESALRQQGMQQDIGLKDIALREQQQGEQRTKLSEMYSADVVKNWQNKNMDGFKTSLSQLNQVDPKAAKEMRDFLGTLSKDGAVNASFNLLGALKSTNPQAQDRLIKNALDSMGVGPQHPLYQSIADILEMPPGEERNNALAAEIEDAERMGLINPAGGAGAGAAKTQKSEILDDGTTIIVDSAGNVTVKDPQNNVLTGEAASAAIRKAKDYGAEIAQKINWSREQGKYTGQKGIKAEVESEVAGKTGQVKEAIKKGTEYAALADKITNQITTLDEGISIAEQAIAEGKSLGRGWFEGKLPKFSETANQFQNVAGRLGLDVISSVAFGALSEAELEMAMATALPQFANDDDTLAWLKRRKESLGKLRNYYDEAAAFLSEGNSIADWKKIQKEKYGGGTSELKNKSTEELLQAF